MQAGGGGECKGCEIRGWGGGGQGRTIKNKKVLEKKEEKERQGQGRETQGKKEKGESKAGGPAGGISLLRSWSHAPPHCRRTLGSEPDYLSGLTGPSACLFLDEIHHFCMLF